MKERIRKNFSWAWIIVIYLWVQGILNIVAAVPFLANTTTEPIALEKVDFTGDIEGLYVSGSVFQIYDYYQETYELISKHTSRDYIIEAGDLHYMGILIGHDELEKADALMYATDSYLSGNADGVKLEDVQFEVTGVIKKMSSDQKEYYYENIGWWKMGDSTRALYLPYYIDTTIQGDGARAAAVSTATAGIGRFIAGGLILYVVHYVRARYGHYGKAAKNYIRKSPNPGQTATAIKKLMDNTQEADGLLYNRWFICDKYYGRKLFGETKKIAWIYKYITKQDTCALCIGFADGTRQVADLENEDMADKHISRLQDLCPQAILGYDRELDIMFQQDINGFLNLRYKQMETKSDNGN